MAAAATKDKAAHIVVLHDYGPDWRWIAHLMPEIEWQFFAVPRVEGRFAKRLNKLRWAWRAARAARAAQLIITFDEGLCAALEIARMVVRGGPPHVTYYFNFDHMPQGVQRARHAALFRRVSRIVVSSRVEQRLYARHFGLDPTRIDFIPWGVKAPAASGLVVDHKDYVCAVGGNARDYAMLMQVASRQPDRRFVIVVRPANIEGLAVPDNVEVMCNIAYADAMAVVKGARLMALPLKTTDTPCGHVTIVSAFYLGTPVIVTRSAGVEDYVTDNQSGLITAAGSSEEMGAAIDLLWADDQLAERLSANARAFAELNCTEQNYPPHVRQMLRLARKGVD